MGSTQLFWCITLSVSKKIKGKGIFTFLKRYFLKWTSHTLYGLLQALIKLSMYKFYKQLFSLRLIASLCSLHLYTIIYLCSCQVVILTFLKKFFVLFNCFYMIFSRCFKTSLCFLALSCLFVALYYHAFM